jgi:hypothetical protein
VCHRHGPAQERAGHLVESVAGRYESGQTSCAGGLDSGG